MATTTEITLKEFNIDQAVGGATLAFSDTGTAAGKITSYVTEFTRVNDTTYSGKADGVIYNFNSSGGCFDGALSHKLFIVEAEIKVTSGTKIPTRGDAGSEDNVDINTLQPREHFAIAALRGIMFHVSNPLSLTGAQIMSICSKAFEIANGMMATAADTRAKVEEGTTPSEDKKEEIEINPNELILNSEKILYNMYVQNNNRAIDDKARFDTLTGASYSDGLLASVKGVKLNTDEETPLIVKLHEDSKIAEVTKVAEVTKITNKVTVGIDGTADVNLASTDVTVPVSGTVRVSNMLTEPVYVSVRNSELDVNVTNMPTVPTEPVSVTGTVSVDNFPSNSTESTS